VTFEAGVWPGENALGPFGTQQLLAGEHRQDLPSEDSGQPRVVNPRELMEDARLVHAARGRQKMEVHMKIDPGAEGLEDGDNPSKI